MLCCWRAAVCALVALAVAVAAQPCAVSTPSTCDFYQCVSQSSHCSASDYPMAYGYKFCSLYGNRMNSFSSEGQAWVNAVRTCLQDALEPYVTPSSPSFVSNCANLTDIAFATHVKCYVDPGFGAKSVCKLSFLDWIQIFITIKGAFVDEFGRTFTQMLLSARDCGNVWLSQVHLTAQVTSSTALAEHTALIQQYAGDVSGLPLNQIVVYSKPKPIVLSSSSSMTPSITSQRVDLFITFLGADGNQNQNQLPQLASMTAARISEQRDSSVFNDLDFTMLAQPTACGDQLCDQDNTHRATDWVPIIAGATVGGAVVVALVAVLVIKLRNRDSKSRQKNVMPSSRELEAASSSVARHRSASSLHEALLDTSSDDQL